MNMNELGWNEVLQSEYVSRLLNLQNHNNAKKLGKIFPGRIASEQKNLYNVFTSDGEYRAIIADKLWFNAFDRQELPAVGDWVLLSLENGCEQLKIQEIMERKSTLSRQSIASHGRKFDKSGTSEEQVVATNIDTVIMVVALDFDYNLRKIERYLTLMWNSGSDPVIILNKADQCENPDELKAEVEAISYGIPVHTMSAVTGQGVDELDQYISSGKTITFIGSSGVGKSTIINHLIGEEVMEVGDVREADKRGRHTTTHRQLIPLSSGGNVIDNPGMREIKIIGNVDNLNQTFPDIVNLQKLCKFRNCQHETEPGCAILQAIHDGDLTEKRYQSYLKLGRELAYLERRKDQRQLYNKNARSKQRVLKEKIKIHKR
ncbi:MAG: ribosome small subunit-dependent GTPase A [Candidatus Cloacimonetes bacterium]|nr:ribosome small subunit-dependent GTPase A [Candidatus Cloacimonadota bacterium]